MTWLIKRAIFVSGSPTDWLSFLKGTTSLRSDLLPVGTFFGRRTIFGPVKLSVSLLRERDPSVLSSASCSHVLVVHGIRPYLKYRIFVQISVSIMV